MPVHNSHGQPRPQAPRHDELPDGLPAPTGSTLTVARRADGTVTPAGAQALGKRGGEAAAARRKLRAQLAEQCGLAVVGDGLGDYIDAAIEFATVHTAYLTEHVGGGELGPAPASMVQSAALALAASRAVYSKASETSDAKLYAIGARLAESSRQTLLVAHELAAKEAKARPPKPSDLPWFMPAPTQPDPTKALPSAAANVDAVGVTSPAAVDD
jgi:hypothetical protein